MPGPHGPPAHAAASGHDVHRADSPHRVRRAPRPTMPPWTLLNRPTRPRRTPALRGPCSTPTATATPSRPDAAQSNCERLIENTKRRPGYSLSDQSRSVPRPVGDVLGPHRHGSLERPEGPRLPDVHLTEAVAAPARGHVVGVPDDARRPACGRDRARRATRAGTYRPRRKRGGGSPGPAGSGPAVASCRRGRTHPRRGASAVSRGRGRGRSSASSPPRRWRRRRTRTERAARSGSRRPARGRSP